MTELEKMKYEAAKLLKNLCVKCKDGVAHNCPVQQVTKQIESLRGVPIIVNNSLYHVMFN